MPTYRFIGEHVTLVMRVRRVRPRARAAPLNDGFAADAATDADEVAAFLDRSGRRYQFATSWSSRELDLARFRMARDGAGRLVACGALWDQGAVKQQVVRGYARSLALARPVLNTFAGLLNQPLLPPLGQPIRSAFVSHLALTSEQTTLDALVGVVEQVRALAAASTQVDYLVAGAPRGSSFLSALKARFGGRELLSRLYVVYWPDGRDAADALDDRPVFPEVALL
jgi:hypothetical protein